LIRNNGKLGIKHAVSIDGDILMKIVLGVADLRIPIWEFINLSDIMVNNLSLKSKKKVKLLQELKEKHDLTIWIDSGGYQILVNGLKINIDDIIRRYSSIPADIYMSLDIPTFLPTEKQYKIVEENIRNFFILTKKFKDRKIIPVIHMYKGKLLQYAFEKYMEVGIDLIAYGGIVPPMLRATRLRLISLLGALILRKLDPKVKIHVLGIGSYVMIRILEKMGIWSIDTSTWRVKAAFGHVIVPGLGERYVGNRKIKFGTPKIRPEELELLYRELEKTHFPLLDQFEDLLKSFTGRALINAWVILKINNGLNRRSGFIKLYEKLGYYNKLPLEELLNEYDKGLFYAAQKIKIKK